MKYKCGYCFLELTFPFVVQHMIDHHYDKEIKIQAIEGRLVRTLNFKIIPEVCREDGRTISANSNSETIHVSKPNFIPKDSPLKKIIKLSNDATQNTNETNDIDIHNISETDTNIAKNSDGISVLPVENSNDNGMEDNDETLQEMMSLLPGAIHTLKECGKLNEFISFNRLLSEKKFPLDNIAFLLFLDVVRWFSLDWYTTSMRYSDEIKLFWRTGLRLFGGRFLRYMGGPKNKGQYTCREALAGKYDSKYSKINFIVPDRRTLNDDVKYVTGNKPCIMKKMVDKVSESDPKQTGTYKICVDGKKINPSSTGEVNLWGYEDKPTYCEKQSRLSEQYDFFNATKARIEKFETFGKRALADCDQTEKDEILYRCKGVVTILSERIRDLRQLKLKKEIFLRKLIEKCSSDWRSSQFVMVISSIKTSIFKIENCIDDLLECNDNFCFYASITRNSMHLFNCKDEVSLEKQENIVCLGSSTDQNTDPSLIKQRSEKWHLLRKTCLITGSTINRGIGLEGLKKQKEFLDEKTGKTQPKEISEELQKMFDHGSVNEIHAVSTFVAKFLPAFHPELTFYEEGCYMKRVDEKPYLIVSPDGSVRNKNSEAFVSFGVEIKCPIPDKLFSTPVHYSLPKYYVPQVLSEMYCLNASKLYFLSYSKDSMTIHLVKFNQKLWNDISYEIQAVNQNENPKRLSASLPGLKESIVQYCLNEVTLVAEIKSCTALPCKHSTSTTHRIYHKTESDRVEKKGFGIEKPNELRELEKTLLRCDKLINESHNLCTQRASEVLVFMMADLDRCFKPELPHAFPIAYGLKGYSMKTEAMSKMIHDVLYTLYLKGLYTPVVSYDGQWAKLAFQSSSGDPLTVLELQKKVFNNVKQRDASTLTKDIFQRCIVKAESFEDLIQKISYVKEKHNILSNGSSVVYSSVYVGTKNGDQIRVSSNLVSIIKTFKSTSNEQGNSKWDDVQSEDNGVDNILATIPSGVMSVLDDEVITSLNTLQLESSKGRNNCDVMNSVIGNESFFVLDNAFGVNEEDHGETEPVTNTKEAHNEIRTQSLEHIKPSQEAFINMETAESEKTIIGSDDAHKIFEALQNKSKASSKWLKYTFLEFKELTTDKDDLTKTMTKLELVLCLDVYNESTLDSKLHFCKSWNKSKLSDLLHEAFTSANISLAPKKKRNGFRNPVSLINNCKKVIKTFPKKIMNIIISEHEFIDELNAWRKNSPFTSTTIVESVGKIVWFSQPEYNYSTLSYIFSFLDVHHLITNCRIKVCKDGFPERAVLRSAWVEVARENTTNLKVSHVEDLIDKQSDAIAKETFSLKVEATMIRLGHTKEAAFCRLIREFYEAEDDPGITASERCYRRINLRDWLLKGVNFCSFPPYGSHIRGIPNIMFQGFLTNIDRRIQLFPYVKSNMYNVRTLGSLEIENFFGEFQDLDPKGSGVIKAEEVPDALESASQLLSTRLMPNRPFHMSLSRAKVYPVKDLMAQCGTETIMPFVYPTLTNCIKLRDHMFDLKDRSKRKAQRKLATISEPDCAARGVAPVRQFHKVDESKILPHKRLGLLLQN